MTQNMVVDILKEWAEKRLEGEILPVVADPSHPPPLRMLLLGTVGTGKTYTAKAGITEARLMLESRDSALTMSFTGVAAANLGVGAKTIDSVLSYKPRGRFGTLDRRLPRQYCVRVGVCGIVGHR